MAAPTIVNFQTTDGGSTFTKPTGLADNDVLYLFFAAFGENLSGSNEPTAPSGFTEIYSVEWTTNPRPFVGCYRKKITSASGEPANYTVGAPASGYGLNNYQGGALYAVRGADFTNPEDDSGAQVNVLVNPTTGANIDSSGNDALLFVNITASTTANITGPSGMTRDLSGDGGDVGVYSQTISSQLVSATRSATCDAGSTNSTGFLVVKPTTGGGGGILQPQIIYPRGAIGRATLN